MSSSQSKELRVLIVDDDRDDIHLIKDYLLETTARSRISIDAAMNLHEARDKVINSSHDVLLLDYQLGAENGLEFIQVIKQAGVKTPIVFLTGKGDEEVAVAALKSGASDYLVKANLSPELLNISIKYVLELARKEEERQEALAALQRSEENYRMLVNNLPGVVFKGYLDWSIDFYDNKIEELTGYKREDFDSRRLKWCDVILPEDLQKVKNRFIKALKTNKLYKREYRIRTPKGKIVWIHSKGQIIIDQAGAIDHVAGVFFNITDLKKAKEDRKKAEKEREKVILKLQDALTQVKTLKGLLPICAHCKKVRDDEGYWQQIEQYIHDHSEAEFSHGICPDCLEKHYPDLFKGD
jgi:PAS domain S-box-containing protein